MARRQTKRDFSRKRSSSARRGALPIIRGMSEEQYLLACLAEECLEVGHRALKAARFGSREVQRGKVEDNSHRIMGELLDLIGVLEMLTERGVIAVPEQEQVRKAVQDKKDKVLRYMQYSREQGQVA